MRMGAGETPLNQTTYILSLPHLYAKLVSFYSRGGAGSPALDTMGPSTNTNQLRTLFPAMGSMKRSNVRSYRKNANSGSISRRRYYFRILPMYFPAPQSAVLPLVYPVQCEGRLQVKRIAYVTLGRCPSPHSEGDRIRNILCGVLLNDVPIEDNNIVHLLCFV